MHWIGGTRARLKQKLAKRHRDAHFERINRENPRPRQQQQSSLSADVIRFTQLRESTRKSTTANPKFPVQRVDLRTSVPGRMKVGIERYDLSPRNEASPRVSQVTSQKRHSDTDRQSNARSDLTFQLSSRQSPSRNWASLGNPQKRQDQSPNQGKGVASQLYRNSGGSATSSGGRHSQRDAFGTPKTTRAAIVNHFRNKKRKAHTPDHTPSRSLTSMQSFDSPFSIHDDKKLKLSKEEDCKLARRRSATTAIPASAKKAGSFHDRIAERMGRKDTIVCLSEGRNLIPKIYGKPAGEHKSSQCNLVPILVDVGVQYEAPQPGEGPVQAAQTTNMPVPEEAKEGISDDSTFPKSRAKDRNDTSHHEEENKSELPEKEAEDSPKGTIDYLPEKDLHEATESDAAEKETTRNTENRTQPPLPLEDPSASSKLSGSNEITTERAQREGDDALELDFLRALESKHI